MVSADPPSLYCPFPSAINPRTMEVQEYTVSRWAQKMGFSEGDKGYRQLQEGQFGVLMGRCHPRATEEDLRLIADFTTWLFLWDDACDRCDENGQSASPEQVQTTINEATSTLLGVAPGPGASLLVQEIWDIRCRLQERMPGHWLQRFCRDTQDYFDATVWQAANRSEGLLLDIETYMRMRRLTGGVYMVIDLIEVAENVTLPLRIRTHPVVAKMIRSCANLIAWANDIFSMRKELLHGDDHNMVMILQRRMNSSITQALTEAIELHNAETRRFIELKNSLPSFGEAEDANLARFVAGMENWMRANVDWSLNTRRYQPGPGLAGDPGPTGDSPSEALHAA